MSGDVNPFAPPETDPELSDAFRIEDSTRKPASLTKVAVRWFLVCSVSAAPSFFLGQGASNGQFAAMTLGVFVFAVGYTLLDYKTASTRIRQKRLISITLRVVYVTRMLLTLFFPIGMTVDLLCGVLSLGATEFLFGSTAVQTFPGAFLTTLTQGVVLNVVLAIYGLLVIGVIMLFSPLFNSTLGRSTVKSEQ